MTLKIEIDWVETIIKPIIEKLSYKLNLPIYHIMGPFGNSNEISVYLTQNAETLKELNLIFLTFIPYHFTSHFKLIIKNYKTKKSSEIQCNNIKIKPILKIILEINKEKTPHKTLIGVREIAYRR